MKGPTILYLITGKLPKEAHDVTQTQYNKRHPFVSKTFIMQLTDITFLVTPSISN